MDGQNDAKDRYVKQLYVLTGYSNFIGQTRKPWVSIDTEAFIQELQKLGYEVHKHSFHDVINGGIDIQNSLVFYSFSHRDNLRHYIRDCLMYLQTQGNTIIPSFELFCCHENKGWQELLKRKLGIHSLDYHYFSSKRELAGYDLRFPLVLKTLSGSNSTGVALVHSVDDVIRTLHKHEAKVSPAQAFDFWRRKYLRGHTQFPGYPNYDLRKDARLYKDFKTPELPFILQEFIPGLSYDYRVIVMGDKYFVAKRHTKAGDFRASGAKLFDFTLCRSEPILDYAKELYQSFQTPFLSIDLGETAEGELYLFEYQALNFGINAIVRGKGYFSNASGAWNFIEFAPVFERYLAEGLDHFIKR